MCHPIWLLLSILSYLILTKWLLKKIRFQLCVCWAGVQTEGLIPSSSSAAHSLVKPSFLLVCFVMIMPKTRNEWKNNNIDWKLLQIKTLLWIPGSGWAIFLTASLIGRSFVLQRAAITFPSKASCVCKNEIERGRKSRLAVAIEA